MLYEAQRKGGRRPTVAFERSRAQRKGGRRPTVAFERSRAQRMHFVYILKSLKDPGQHYVGITENIGQRLQEHNSGKSIFTNKYKPWKLETYVAFSNEKPAHSFERYLKQGSGFAFLKKHLI